MYNLYWVRKKKLICYWTALVSTNLLPFFKLFFVLMKTTSTWFNTYLTFWNQHARQHSPQSKEHQKRKCFLKDWWVIFLVAPETWAVHTRVQWSYSGVIRKSVVSSLLLTLGKLIHYVLSDIFHTKVKGQVCRIQHDLLAKTVSLSPVHYTHPQSWEDSDLTAVQMIVINSLHKKVKP